MTDFFLFALGLIALATVGYYWAAARSINEKLRNASRAGKTIKLN